MAQIAELLTTNTWLVGLIAVVLTGALGAALRARGDSITAKRKRAWGQAIVCCILAAATEYARATAAGEGFDVNRAMQWATANVGASLMIYRAGKRAAEWLRGLLSDLVDKTREKRS